MREPQRILVRAQAAADLVKTFGELRIALTIGGADAGQFLILRQILRGRVDARTRGYDVVGRHARLGELLQRGGGDIDARLAEAAQREGSRELRIEFVRDSPPTS